MIVLDASVILKWFLDEEDHTKALIHRQRHLEGADTIVVPELLFYEIPNVFVMRTQMSAEEIQANLEQLQSYELEVADFIDLKGMVDLARQHNLTAYDASYVALARRLRCRFVTADEGLLLRLKGVPHVVHLGGLDK